MSDLFFHQMMRKYSGSITLLIFSLFVFIILPCINTGLTSDPELTPRYLLTSFFVFLFSAYFLFIKKDSISIDRRGINIFILVILLLFWTAISISQSINKGDAFSEWLRLAVLYFVFFISTIIFKKSDSSFSIISRSSVIAVFIFSIIAFFQLYTHLSEYILKKDMFFNTTLTSSLANKNFFSEVLVLFLPLLIAGLMDERKSWRLLFIISVLIDLFFIILLKTISVWIAILISVLLFFILAKKYKIKIFSPDPENYWGWFHFSGKNKFVIIISVVLLLSGGLIAYTHTANYEMLASKIKKVTEYYHHPELISITRDENNNSVFERLLIWRNSLRMIADHPLFGAGLNNWKLYNPAYGIGGTEYINTGMINYEHPHNDYLLVLAEQGPAGIVLYLFLLILIIKTGINKIKVSDNNSRRHLLLLICSVVIFMILSFFSYPRSRIYSMILLMINSALIISFPSEQNLREISIKPWALTMLLVSVFATTAAFNRYNSDVHIKNTVIAQLNSNFVRMMREADKAESWYFPLDLTGTPVSWYKGMAFYYEGDIPAAIREYEKAILINPNHLRVLNDLASSYEQNGEREKAVSYYRRALDITPLFTEGNLNISAAYYNLNKYDSAYYFIDRLYGLKNIEKTKNYSKFLEAILYAKASEEISKINDSVLIKKMMPVIADADSLKQIYENSKAENISFNDCLKKYYTSDNK